MMHLFIYFFSQMNKVLAELCRSTAHPACQWLFVFHYQWTHMILFLDRSPLTSASETRVVLRQK